LKLLLDECVDQRLAAELSGHDVSTVAGMKWTGIKNGELLRLAGNSFDVFITVDRNLSFQQNLPTFNIVVLVLSAKTNRLVDLRPLVPIALQSLRNAKRGEAIVVSG
jgi:uncharacterized protein DUF5615